MVSSILKNKEMMHNRQGFSLIETAIVIAIVSIITLSISALIPVNTKDSKNAVTVANISMIETALGAFVAGNGRLPCPASVQGTLATFGTEGSCAPGGASGLSNGIYHILGASSGDGANEDIYVGAVPTRALGIADTYMYDGYGMRINYAMPRVLAESSVKYNSYTSSLRPIVIEDAAGDVMNTSDSLVAYVLLSHGQNMNGANNNNADGSNPTPSCTVSGLDYKNCLYISSATFDAFVDAPYNSISASYYDDYIKWKTFSLLNVAAAQSGSAASVQVFASRFVENNARMAVTNGSPRQLTLYDSANNIIGVTPPSSGNSYTTTVPPGTYLIRGYATYSPGINETVTNYLELYNATSLAIIATSPTYEIDVLSIHATFSQEVSAVVTFASATNIQLLQYFTVSGTGDANLYNTGLMSGSSNNAFLEIVKIF